nr:GIY-YIG [Cafeteriavirus-dependent mavirus]CAI9421374.1 GIY-YIG [Cafeteriavirus-dependent mavirus]
MEGRRIYKLHSTDHENVYYGSTKHPLNQRLSKHKADYKQWLVKGGTCTTSRVLFERAATPENVKIELMEEATELNYLERERYYIDNYKCVNKNIPSRTVKEYCKQYYQDNRDQLLEKVKEYNQTNKEKLRKKNICELCGGSFTHENKSHHLKSKKHQSALNREDL